MKLELSLLPGMYAVCRLDAHAAIPEVLLAPVHEFLSITRTTDELSIVCPEEMAPEGAKVSSSWRAFKVQGPLDFSSTGVIASLTAPLAEGKISLFTVATYDTDYILVQEKDLGKAILVFGREHQIMH